MGRKSTLPTFATLAEAQATILANPAVAMACRSGKSGGEWHDLTRRMHRADPRCVVCGLPTLHSRFNGPMAATLGTLIPCAMLDDFGGVLRRGYIPGNLALMCRACVDASNAYGTANSEPVVFEESALTLPANVWTAWPQLVKAKAPDAPTAAQVKAIMVGAPRHREAARIARQRLGYPF